MKNYIFVFLMSIQGFCAVAQHPECPTGGSPDLTYFDLSSQGTHPNYTLKIYFTIVRNDDESGGYPSERIPNIISRIDGVFNPQGIFFEYVCENKYFNNTHRLQSGTGGDNQSLWCEWYDPSIPTHSDGIDVFIIAGNSITGANGRVSGIPCDFIVLAGGNSSNVQNQYDNIEGTSIIHELGHGFGLLHMFHGATQNPNLWPNGYGGGCSNLFATNPCDRQFSCPASSSFVNCSTSPVSTDTDATECAESSTNGNVAGDYIPDTPPSHFYADRRGLVNCQYNSITLYNHPDNLPIQGAPLLLDPDGNEYEPDVTNFMCITSSKGCRDHFTTDQWTVMKNHIDGHPALQNIKSTNGELICDCDYENIIYLRETKNWSTVIAEQGISSSQLSDFEIVIEENLIINQDYTFDNVKFTFTTDSELFIDNSDVVFQSNANGRTSLSSCQGRWNGISINGNSDVSISATDIDNTKNAITSNSGSDLTIDDVNISNTSQTGIVVESGASLELDRATIFGLSGTSSTGIRLNQGATASSISDFTIQDFDYGIRGRNLIGTTSIVDGTVTNADAGIWLRGTLPIIDEVDINNAFFGMYIDQSPGGVITNCNVASFTSVGMAIDASPALLIMNNTTGSVSPGTTGMVLRNCGGSLIADNPSIRANSYGIHIAQSDLTMARCTVEVSSSIGSASYGVQLVNNVNSQLVDNVINADQTASGIETVMCTSTDITNNQVNHFSESPDRTAAIRSMGSIDETIEENDINSVFLVSHNSISQASGLMAQNSTVNTYDCNFIDETTEGLGVYFNADFHTIRGNHFLNSLIDLEIRSVVGRQEHHGNVFVNGEARATQLSTDDVLQSRFIANCAHPTVNDLCPSNPQPQSGWFENDPSTNSFHTCSGNIGPGLVPDDTSLCNYFNDLKTKKDSMPEQFFVKLYHLLRLEKVKSGYVLPKCIKQDSTLLSLCGLLELVEAKASLDYIVRTDVNTSKLSTSQTNYEIAGSGIKQQTKESLKTEMEAARQLLTVEILKDSLSLDSLRSEIDLINCTDSLLVKWKDILKTYISYVQDGEVDQADRYMIASESRSCSDKYGDAIHLARALANTYSNTHFDIFDDCTSKATSPRSSRSVESDISVFPNPSTGLLNIEFGISFTGTISVLDLTGKILLSQDIVDLKQTNVRLDGAAGVYYLHCKSDEGRERIQKILLVD